VLVAGFEPFQGAPSPIIKEHRTAPNWTIRYNLARPEYERMLTALEVRYSKTRRASPIPSQLDR
jgi:hypothetical protein